MVTLLSVTVCFFISQLQARSRLVPSIAIVIRKEDVLRAMR